MKTLTLHLDGITPEKLSMKRLTEYLRELATLYGSEDSVHFQSVTSGSACLNADVEEHRYQAVISQVREVAGGVGSKRPTKAYTRLADLMFEDRVDGSLKADGANIVQFPRAKCAEPPLVIVKQSSVQGRLYSVGGKDDTIPVRLEGADGETLNCEADMVLAEQLGTLIFKHIRLHGDGEWERRQGGGWKLKKLRIKSYEKLENIGFKTAVSRLRSAGGLLWNEKNSPHAEVLDLRG
jgi:hypothetical protein